MTGWARKATMYLDGVLGLQRKPSEGLGLLDLRFFVRFLRPLSGLAAASVVLGIFSTLMGSLMPLSAKVIIDFVVMKQDLQGVRGALEALDLGGMFPLVAGFLGSLELVVLAVLVVGAAIGILEALQRYTAMRFQQELAFNVQTALFGHILRFPVSFFGKKHTGYLASRVSDDVGALEQLFSNGIVYLVTRAFYVAAGFAIVFALSAKLALVLLCLMPLHVLINRYFAWRVRITSADEREGTARVSEQVQEVLSGVQTVKGFAAEERESGKVTQRIRSVIDLRVRETVITMLSEYSGKALRLISTVLVMWFGAREMLGGGMSVGDYVALTSYAVFLTGAINGLSMYHVLVQPALASVERIKELFAMLPEPSVEAAPHVLQGYDSKASGEVIFKDVSFGYEEAHLVLRGVSFTARPGEVVALVGPSGAGKTTIVNLILRFYDPQAGAVLLDGRDLRELDPVWLRKQVGVVAQDVFIFDDTVSNNIKYGKPSASEEDVVRAARMAGVHDDIMGFPLGYKTMTGERGVRLSAGQRQRLSIARAFLGDPPILVFDEPTSALDSVTEETVKGSLRALARDRTTFVIAHRLSVAEIADKVLLLEGGKIQEYASLEELRQRGGVRQAP